MAFAYIQSDTGQTGGGTGTLDLAFGSSVTSGSLLVAVVAWNHGATETASVSDDVNGSWTAVGSGQQGVGGLADYRLQIFYKTGASSGTTTVTAQTTGFDQIALSIAEYSGTSVSVDGTPVYNTHDSATPTSSAITTTADGDLLLLGGFTGFAYSSAGSGFTFRESTTVLIEDDTDGGTAGSKTASYNCTSNDNILGFIAFQESGGGGTNATVDLDTADVVAVATASIVAPPKPRPTPPFAEVNLRM